MKLVDAGMCFVCGKNNERGLKLDFDLDEKTKTIKTFFTPEEWHQGFGGITHGGIVGVLLDEVMVNLAFKLGIKAVTGEMKLRLRAPLEIGSKIEVIGRIEKETSKVVYANAEARLADRSNEVIAEATGKLFVVKDK